ncbi:hypothetical protein SAMN02927903_03217 [Flavobacterium caeni]|uniref:Uncharacterized protein n=1 Tax=Flavobacterium caeni TaxID=490189 RepID=A0A1G5KBQ0_9FLAO|nr:hypothetical protein SAMN02927903_03217 [Flavobacterium caeni]
MKTRHSSATKFSALKLYFQIQRKENHMKINDKDWLAKFILNDDFPGSLGAVM